MKDLKRAIKNNDVGELFDLIENRRKRCYFFSTDEEPLDIFFQLCLDKEMPQKLYLKKESRLFTFLNEIKETYKVIGIASVTDKISLYRVARKSKQYYKKFKLLEKECKLRKFIELSEEDFKLFFLIATRGIGETVFFFEDLELAILLIDLHGTIIFGNTSRVKEKLLFDLGEKYEIIVEEME